MGSDTWSAPLYIGAYSGPDFIDVIFGWEGDCTDKSCNKLLYKFQKSQYLDQNDLDGFKENSYCIREESNKRTYRFEGLKQGETYNLVYYAAIKDYSKRTKREILRDLSCQEDQLFQKVMELDQLYQDIKNFRLDIKNLPKDKRNQINILICGNQAVGKSSFINTLASSTKENYQIFQYTNRNIWTGEGTTIKLHKIPIITNESVQINLVDMPGFDISNSDKNKQGKIELKDIESILLGKSTEEVRFINNKNPEFSDKIHAVCFLIDIGQQNNETLQKVKEIQGTISNQKIPLQFLITKIDAYVNKKTKGGAIVDLKSIYESRKSFWFPDYEKFRMEFNLKDQYFPIIVNHTRVDQQLDKYVRYTALKTLDSLLIMAGQQFIEHYKPQNS